MAEGSRPESDPSLAHLERRGGGDNSSTEVAPVAEPMCGWHNREADEKANEKYFRRSTDEERYIEKQSTDPYENVRVLLQAKPKLVGVDLGVSTDPGDVSVANIPTFEDYPVYTTPPISVREFDGHQWVTKDSGLREEFPTGSRRDTRTGKGRYDLLPPYAIQRLAQVYERGAAKYGDRNWEKGQPLSRFLDSALRHTFQVLEGKTDEDHAGQAAWNLLAFIEIQHRINEGVLPKELNDL